MMNSWQKAKVIKIRDASLDIKVVVLEPENFTSHQAGQHYEVCMPGENIIRKYSVMSPIQEKKYIELGIELIENGALSPKLWNLKEGDFVEIRGPIGNYFVWDASKNTPLVLIGGGSGITPLLSIYNSYTQLYPEGKSIFIMSVRDTAHLMDYKLLKDILITRFTKEEGRIDASFLEKSIGDLLKNTDAIFYLSGPYTFIMDIMNSLVILGVPKNNIQLESFI